MIDKKIIDKLLDSLKMEVYNSEVLNLEYIYEQFKKNPSIYLFYPYLFTNSFDLKDSEDLKKLSIAGFLYYLSLLQSDYLIDNKEEKESRFIKEKIFLIEALTEQSIKILSTLFDYNSDFWSLWNKRKKEYHKSILNESASTYDNFETEIYKKIAENKSAFAKVAIDSCYLMSGEINNDLYDRLLRSHTNFSIGFQILDDISDIREDYKNNQVNYAIYIAKKNNLLINPELVEDDIKYFYYSDLILTIFEEAFSYFDLAIECLGDYKSKCESWINVIKYKKQENVQKIQTIKLYQNVNSQLTNQSKTKIGNEGGDLQNNITSAINKSIDYILSSFNTGYWEEYITQAGVSSYWATSFIGTQLKPLANEYPAISKVLNEAKHYIESNKNPLWSFNEQWNVEDADTSNFCFLFLSNELKKNNTNKLEKWFTFQKDDGGFSTYNDESNLRKYFSQENYFSYDGWTQSHFCVSSVALHVLYEHKELYQNEWEKLNNYISDKLDKDLFDSYWWTDEIYSIYYISTISHLVDFPKDIIDNKLKKLSLCQNANGSFSDFFGESLFYTGLALMSLSTIESFQKNLENGIMYLLKNQFTDGSWENSNSLRIPRPENLIPEISNFNNIKTFGTNVRAMEFKRLFTTSVCLNALYQLKNII